MEQVLTYLSACVIKQSIIFIAPAYSSDVKQTQNKPKTRATVGKGPYMASTYIPWGIKECVIVNSVIWVGIFMTD